MIKRSDLTTVGLFDFYQVMTNIDSHLGQENLEILQLTDVVSNDYKPALLKLDQALIPIRDKELSKQMADWDTKRDTNITGTRQYLKGASLNPDAKIAEGANMLLNIMNGYGKNIQRKPMRKETGIISNLVQDYEKPEYAEIIKLIGVGSYVSALKENNSKFEAVYNDRTRMEAAIEIGAAKEARIVMQKAFTKVVKTINALAFLKGEEAYKQLTDNINREVKQAMLTVSLRKKKDKDESKEA